MLASRQLRASATIHLRLSRFRSIILLPHGFLPSKASNLSHEKIARVSTFRGSRNALAQGNCRAEVAPDDCNYGGLNRSRPRAGFFPYRTANATFRQYCFRIGNNSFSSRSSFRLLIPVTIVVVHQAVGPFGIILWRIFVAPIKNPLRRDRLNTKSDERKCNFSEVLTLPATQFLIHRPT